MKQKSSANKLIKEYGIIFVLIFVMGFFGVMKPEFLTVSNFFTIMKQTSVVAICGVGMLLVLITGGINLSVGFVISTTGMLSAIFMVWTGMPTIVAMLLVTVIMLLVGALEGVIIAYANVAPFIATLAFMNILKGFSFLITGGRSVADLPDSFTWLGTGNIGVIPVPFILMLVALLMSFIILKKLYFGRYFFAIGSNEEAARLAGINVKSVKVMTYVLSSFFAAFAGFVMLARVKTASPTTGTGYETDVIMACVLGGVSMAGGYGKTYQVFIGSVLIAVLNNGLIMMQVSEYFQVILKGMILLAAVVYDSMQKNKKIA